VSGPRSSTWEAGPYRPGTGRDVPGSVQPGEPTPPRPEAGSRPSAVDARKRRGRRVDHQRTHQRQPPFGAAILAVEGLQADDGVSPRSMARSRILNRIRSKVLVVL